MNIDFHAHIYPEDYLKKLEASTGDVRIETDAKGEKWIFSMVKEKFRTRPLVCFGDPFGSTSCVEKHSPASDPPRAGNSRCYDFACRRPKSRRGGCRLVSC